MAHSYTLTFSSELNTPAAAVWEVVGTMPGINAELSPWLQMTAPAGAENLRIEDAALNEPLFASWVLFRGVLPIDRHFFKLVQVDPGRGLVEDSTSWSQQRWEHRRLVESTGPATCVLTDRLAFTPRASVMGPLVVRVIDALFRHRHRRLHARFGGHSLPA